MSWKTLSEEILHQNQWTSFRRREFEMENGKRGEYFYLKTRGGCSTILPRLPDGKFILIRDYRYLDDVTSVEFPGGGIDTDQTPEEAARVELRQEVGYEAKKFKLIGRCSPCAGVVVDPTFFYIAEELVFVGVENEITENIEMLTASEAEIDQMIRDGLITNGQTLSAWAIYKAQAS